MGKCWYVFWRNWWSTTNGWWRRRNKKSAKDTAHYYKKQEEEEQQQQLPTYDKLISLAKRNGLWPASEGKAVLGCLMKYNKNFDKIFEDYQSKIESVDLILTLLVLAALEKYEQKNQIEWAPLSIKAKKKLSTKKIDADAEIKDLSMAL